MGGRFDATNVVTPLVSVITTIALDHRNIWAKRWPRSPSKKPGSSSPGVPVVCGVSGGPALQGHPGPGGGGSGALRSRSSAGARAVGGRRSRPAIRSAIPIDGETYRFAPGLPGEHQGRNAADRGSAAARSRPTSAFAVGRRDDRGGTRIGPLGRASGSVGRRPRVFLDGAHNEDGASALAAFIEEPGPRPPVLVFAMMKDKAIGRVARILFPEAAKIILTSIPYARAAAPASDPGESGPMFARKIVLEPDPPPGPGAGPAPGRPVGTVLVAGRLFLVGEVKKAEPVWF